MKLIVCDVEGTIFQAKYKIAGTDYASTMWQPIAELLGEAAIEEERKTHEIWENLKYDTYIDWVKDTIKIHKKYSLHEKDFNALIDNALYCKGVEDFFLNLDREKYIPVLISGGFQNLNDRAQRDLKIDHSFGACRYLFDKEGYLETWNLYPCDFKDKFDHVKLLIKQYGLNPTKDWIFIGDGKNDKYIAEKAPIAIAFGDDAHPELAEKCYAKIESFIELVHILEDFDAGKIEGKLNIVTPKKDIKQNIASPDSEIQKIIKQRDDALKHSSKLKRDKSELMATVVGKKQKKENEEEVYESDYMHEPAVRLVKILDNHKVAFIGMKEGQTHFDILEKLHKNLVLIAGDNNRFDESKLTSCEFIFFFKPSAGHSVGSRVEKSFKSTPHANLWKDIRAIEPLTNAMANVLCRYWDLN